MQHVVVLDLEARDGRWGALSFPKSIRSQSKAAFQAKKDCTKSVLDHLVNSISQTHPAFKALPSFRCSAPL